MTDTMTALPVSEPPGAPSRPRGSARLTNMSLALKTMMDCLEVHDSSPRFSVFYGPSGYGKSVSAAFTAARVDAVYVEARSIWTQRSVLENIAHAYGIVRLERTGPRILDQLIDHLNTEPRPLIIDEMDYLVKKQLVDILRDLHDATRIPIMMIGMEELPAKLKEWEQFDNRILITTAAQPASDQDALLLRDHYCLDVKVADDLALMIRDRCRRVVRRIVTNLNAVQRAALEAGRTTADVDWWGNRPIENGDLKVRR